MALLKSTLCLALALAAPMAALAAHHPTQGYLGVGLRDLTDDQISALRLKDNRGAEVILVDHDAPAGKVGLREHDVILQVDNAVINNAEEFNRIMRETPAGHTLSLLISREGQQQTITVTLADRTILERSAWGHHYIPGPPPGYESGNDPGNAPPPEDAPPSGPPNNQDAANSPTPTTGDYPGSTRSFFSAPFLGRPTYTGVMLEPVGQLADIFGVRPGLGLLVKNIDANSPAAAAGLKPGDVVIRINSGDCTRPDDWFRAIRETKGRPLQLTVVRNHQEQALSITPGEYHRH
jgi:serine protease Do